jgi:DNA repair exonuclease SbcCD ATPase subunit
MFIKEWGWRNFRAYGNAWTGIKLSDNGSLNLLVGENGSGKSSVIEALDYAIYGKVKGKKKETIPVSELVNEINSTMETRVYLNVKDDVWRIDRTSKGVTAYKNNEELDRANKKNKEVIVESELGIDFKTYKSFVSLNINYFKNFLSMSIDEKRLVRDKLLNFEQFEEIQKKNKKYKSEFKKLDSELSASIESLEYSMTEFTESMNKLKESKRKTKDEQLDELKGQLSNLKNTYQILSDKLNKGETIVLPKVESEYTDATTKMNATRYKIAELEESISNWKSIVDKCPTCGSIINPDELAVIISQSENVLSECKILMGKQKETVNILSDKLFSTKSKIRELQRNLSSLESDASYVKGEIKSLKDSLKDDSYTEDIEKSLKEIKKKIEQTNKKKSQAELSLKASDFIADMFGDNGLRGILVGRIVKPINSYLAKYTKELGVTVDVAFDEEFEPHIRRRGQAISPERLSDGQLRRANLAILLSYLSIILKQTPTNILFLDEVFASVDIQGIKSIIEIMKNFSKENNVNIFIVHHSQIDTHMFDAVYQVEMDVFSKISVIPNGEDKAQECAVSWDVSIL